MSHSNEGLAVGAALGKFDSSDSNERFRQMFTNVKIRKQKIEHLKNLTLEAPIPHNGQTHSNNSPAICRRIV